MFHYGNAYNIPNALVRGWACKTNIPSNTGAINFIFTMNQHKNSRIFHSFA